VVRGDLTDELWNQIKSNHILLKTQITSYSVHYKTIPRVFIIRPTGSECVTPAALTSTAQFRSVGLGDPASYNKCFLSLVSHNDVNADQI